MWLVGGGWKVSTHNRYILWTLSVRVLIVGGQEGGWWAADTQTMQCQCPVCPVSQSQGLAAAETETQQAGAGRGRVTPPLVLPRSISGPSHISCVEMTAINYRRGWGGGARPGRRVL